jgi:hypothetical protein
MRYPLPSTLILAASLLLFSCNYHKKLIKEEVILKNKNSVTGTIVSCDSNNVNIQKMDESHVNVAWTDIDTIVGKRYKTLFLGFNTGFYNVPYFSVFRNEAINAKSLGFQFKIGKAVRGRQMNYFTFTTIPAQPYHINKFGLGFQRYFKKGSYAGANGFFWGLEYNLMNAKYNNGVQMALDPYWGYDKKLKEQLRLNFKMGFQINLANKNNAIGINITAGIHFLKRNFKKYYTELNQYHHLPKN